VVYRERARSRANMKALILLAAISFASRPAHAQANAEEPAILAVVNGLFDAMRKADSTMARPLFHAKARLITVDSRNPVPEIEETADQFIRFIGTPRTTVLDERTTNVRVLIDGAMASVWADYRLYRGDRFVHCGVDHFLMVKEGGFWKIIELADTRRRDNCG
jgi:hypothetical protein